MAEQDYVINAKAEEEVKAIMHHLEQQDEFMLDILRRLEDNQRLLLVANRILEDKAVQMAPTAEARKVKDES